MSTRLRNGSTVQDPRLDRLPSETTEHLEKYPLTASTMPSVPTSMTIGINWYRNFSDPVRRKINGRWRWVIGEGDLGPLDGGHAICAPHEELSDLYGWWLYYNQLNEGRCTEFSLLRVMSQMNRLRYDITSRWHYWEFQRTDEWEGGMYPGASPQYEGSSVRASLEVARSLGVIPARRGGRPIAPAEAPALVKPEHGIAAYRWALNWDDVRRALGTPDDQPGIELNNSWGKGYPHTVLLLDAAGERVLREDGEFGIVTDR